MLQANHVTKTYSAGKKIALQDFSIHVPKASVLWTSWSKWSRKNHFHQNYQPNYTSRFWRSFHQWRKTKSSSYQRHRLHAGRKRVVQNMTVGDQILYFGALKGMKKQDALSQAKYWFDRLEIDHWWNKKLSELSKGMAQKIQFVVTVLHQPKLLILDEPFSGFDPVNANLVKDQILQLKEQGTTIILSTHRMESVEELCDSVALINKSRKILDGKVFEVREKFKQNLFNVVLSDVNSENLETLKNQYQLVNIHDQHGLISFDLNYNEDQNLLLNDLMKAGKIKKF